MNVPALPNLFSAAAVGSIRHAIAATSIPQPPVPTTPSLTDAHLPRITLTVTARRVRGVPRTLKAGRYLLTVIGEPVSSTSPGGVMLIQLPDGITLEEAMSEGAGDAPPPFYLRSVMPGGVGIGEDGLSRSVIDLVPGEWIVAGYAMSTVPTRMTVTGAQPATAPDPPADVVVTLDTHGIGIDGSLRAGRNVIRIDNVGILPRFVDIERVAGGGGRREVVASSVDQSALTSMWLQVTLEAGTYVLQDGTNGASTTRIAAA